MTWEHKNRKIPPLELPRKIRSHWVAYTVKLCDIFGFWWIDPFNSHRHQKTMRWKTAVPLMANRWWYSVTCKVLYCNFLSCPSTLLFSIYSTEEKKKKNIDKYQNDLVSTLTSASYNNMGANLYDIISNHSPSWTISCWQHNPCRCSAGTPEMASRGIITGYTLAEINVFTHLICR